MDVARQHNRRTKQDRRKPTPFLNPYNMGISGRRVAPRRATDSTTYVDHYGWSTGLVALGIIVMSVMDAAFTLSLLSKGAVELNAIMAVLIEQDIRKFVVFKVTLTSLSVLLLVIHKNAVLSIGISVKRIAQLIFVGYAVLMGYELMLFRIIN